MISRRDFLTAASATAIVAGLDGGQLGRAAAQGRIAQADLLRFEPVGNVTLVHLTDIHGQLMPLHFREPSINIGVGEAKGVVPHLTGNEFLKDFKIEPNRLRRTHSPLTILQSWRVSMAAWAVSTASPPSSRRSAPNATARCCCSTAVTPGRTAGPR